MVGYEYKVIPAPAKGLKAPGVKAPEARFANALEHRINELAAEGWEYQRSDILPSEERQGLTSSHIVYRSVLVFRRELTAAQPDEVIETPAVAEPATDAVEQVEIADDTPETESAEQEAAPETTGDEKKSE